MVLGRWNLLAALAVASAGLGGFSAIAEDETAPALAPLEVVGRVAAQEGQPVPVELVIDEPQFAFVADVAEESSPYWIGVQLEPPTDILKQHLNLEGGMVTVHVFEGSPAEKAGLKANDIILKAADTYIKEPNDLLKLVGKSQEHELTLVLLRGGKETTLKVVPAKRPQEGKFKVTATEEKEAVQKLEAALHAYRHRAAEGAAQAIDVVRVHSGVVASAAHRALELPKDVAIRVTKEGASPAKIWVKRAAKEWEVTEDKLDELPEDVRAYLQQFRSGSHQLQLKSKSVTLPYKTVTGSTPMPPAAAETSKVYSYRVVEANHAAGDMDSKLDRILKIVSQKEDSSVSELRKEVQQLRKELAELRQEKK